MVDKKERVDEEFWGSRGPVDRPQKKQKSAARFLWVIFIIIFAVFCYAGYRVASNWLAEGINPDGQSLQDGPRDKFNLLILGTDRRENDKGRADTVMVVFFDQKNNEMKILSMPRDTYVRIPGYGRNKLGHAYAYGGSELIKETVENLLDIPLNGYVELDFAGFADVVDVLGGIRVDVEKRMYYPQEKIDLQPGPQVLNGEDALAYVRYRSDGGGDIMRIQRQQKFLRELAGQTLQLKTVLKLPQLVREVNESVRTDLSITRMLALARIAQKVDPAQMEAAMLPGTPMRINGADCWDPDLEKKDALVEEFFARNLKERK